MTATQAAPTLSCLEREALETAERIIKRGGAFSVWNAQDIRNVKESLRRHTQHEQVRVALALLNDDC